MEYVDIIAATDEVREKVKQNLKFRTNKFVWKVKFNIPLDPKTVNNVNLYVTTMNQTPLKTAIRYNSIENEIEIEPMDEGYTQNESYILNITQKVMSAGGQALKNPVQLQFKID